MSSRFPATNATGYEHQMGRWSRLLAPQLLAYAGLQAGSCVLDLGCGTGSLTRAVLDRIGEAGCVVGVDISAPFIEHARANVTDERASFDVQDATQLSFASGEFDASVSLLVLNFIPDARTAVAEMLRVTRSGGVIAAATWDVGGGLVLTRIFYDTAAALDPEATAVRARGQSAPLTHEGELGAAFREAGAREVEETDLMVRMRFTNFDDYYSSFLTGQSPPGAYLVGLDEERRARLRAALFDAYRGGRDDGPRSFVAVAHAMRGRTP
jgi:SAM-dependent methyltransferase